MKTIIIYNKHMIRLIAADMDGTCLDTFKRISARNLRAMKILQERGVIIVPASGRALESIPSVILKDPSFRYVLTSNGSRVTDRDENSRLFCEEIPLSVMKRLLEEFRRMPVTIGLQVNDRYVVQGGTIASAVGLFAFRSDMEKVSVVRNIDKVLEDAEGVEKITMFYRNPSARAKVSEILKEYPGLQTAFTSVLYAEICAAGAGKGNALKKLREVLGISREETACIGDGENDLTMFDESGMTYAPASASKVILAKTDVITADNRSDAFFRMTEDLMKKHLV